MAKKPLKKQLKCAASQIVAGGFILAIVGVILVQYTGFCIVDSAQRAKRKLLKEK